MSRLHNFITPLHTMTERNYLARMVDNKVECMIVAKKYGKDYWDGERRYGYGGYKYIPSRWKGVAKELIQVYQLGPGSKVLDVGCGKGFLLHEMLLLEPKLDVMGFDISGYAIDCATDLVKPYLYLQEAQEKYSYLDKSIDLVISLGTLHNLCLPDLERALIQIERVAKQAFIMVESFRNEKELYNLQCWALTCQSFFDDKTWISILKKLGYSGDYEFIYFE